MNITEPQLIAAGVGPTQAASFVNPFNAACDRFDITTSRRIAAFLGQCMVESGNLVHTEENLYYSNPARIAAIFPREFPVASVAGEYAKNPAKLGASIYANRLGNGDEASGDGYRYRGRGLLQITGRARYAAASAALGCNYLESPDLVSSPVDACLTAAWYWDSIKANALADAGAIDAITKAVNGPGMLEASLRRQFTAEALDALNS